MRRQQQTQRGIMDFIERRFIFYSFCSNKSLFACLIQIDNKTILTYWHICFVFSKAGQLISVCNYWNDPTKRSSYLDTNVYLPYLNNEVSHENSQRYKDNFVNLNKVVLSKPASRPLQLSLTFRGMHRFFFHLYSQLNGCVFFTSPECN